MIMLLALPVLVAVTAMHRYLQSYAPTNLLIRHLRAQRPRWRTANALIFLAVILVVAMHALGEFVASGAPGWLNLAVLLLAWDAIKIGLLAVLTMTSAGLFAAKRVWSWIPRRLPRSALGEFAQDGR